MKSKAIRDFPAPTTKTEIRAFLGLAGYYRQYIPMFSIIAAPLTDLLKGRSKKGEVTWSTECRAAFEKLKTLLTSEPVLYAPDFTKKFVLQTDASEFGMGAVLSQIDDEKSEHPVLYLSKKFSEAEKKYCTTEKECAAIVWAIRKLHCYLDGQNFTVQTDHNPLVWLRSNASTNPRLMRWALALQPYDFEVVHRKGVLNKNADKGAFKTLKKKPKKFAKKFSFWNEDLRISRNKVNRLFKTYIKHKTEGSILEIIQSSGNAYRKERAIYKKLLLSTKRKAWESFCLNHNERFGFLFNLVFNRGSSDNFIGVNPNNDPNNTIEDKINYLMDNFFPSPSAEDNLDYTPIIGHVEPMVLEDIEMVINALKGGKAPGLDRIDFRMWRAVFIHDKEFILDLINICFKFNYFPEHLRNAKVFFLLKDGKDPGLCTSYRPVCLLPTLGKIIERLFLLQLNKWLDRNNIIHHNQYGFREGKSCDLAIHDLIETIKIRMPSEHLALVSLDIKSAFDTMNWPVLFKTLESYGFPAFFKNFIYFLSQK
ncbi:Retrovirus-related Pol polyprotein from transposon 17.6 [Araneus ventricosus]|uniref:RNA-directed DNA polymerase n=1 Tax=Araneus ventricosus TaxID=182803 RepID=A0A4Y2GJ68_ARAVE|nr:Retrovirus-related Pol polyprotein from transposon 17.6 [Araneus ventricosus]